MTVETPDEYCARRMRESGSSFYYSFKLLPAEKRSAMYTLYAFFRHTDDLVDEVPSSGRPSTASTLLEEWRQEFQRCCDHRPQHPITVSLRCAMDRFSIPRDPFDLFIEGVRMDLETFRYPNFADLYRYCYRVAAAPGMASIHVLGNIGERSLEYAENLGIALQLTNIIRDVGEDAVRGRIYLPVEDLDRFGCPEEDIRDRQASPSFRELMRFQCDRARSFYRKAKECLRQEDRRTVLCPEIMSAVYEALLEKIERVDYDVLRRRVSIPASHKLALALATYIRCR